MAYSSYVSDITSKSTTLTEFNDNTKKIDLESIWEGNASTKQRSNLNTLQGELSTQVKQLSSLSDAMTNIDEYDRTEKELKEARNALNSLDKDDKDYASRYSELSQKIRELTDKKQQLKATIDRTLTSITTNYSSQHNKIEKVELKETVKLLKSTESELNKIKFDILATKTTPQEVTTSTEAGTIQIDNTGTPYDTEPVPGKAAQKLHVYHDGTRLYDDAYITIKKGETIRLSMNLTDNCGDVELLRRTSADGGSDWKNYVTSYSEPFVDRYDSSTFLEQDNYDWVITGNQTTNGYITLSQTSSHSTAQGEYKSMYRIHVKVVD